MHGVGDRRDEEDEGGGTSCVALKRSPEEDEDWSCLGCRTAGKARPARPGNCPHGADVDLGKQDVVAGGRRCGAGCGATRRRGCLSTTTSRTATTTRSTTRATLTAGVRRASPRTQPRRDPMMPADGRPCDRDRPGRRTACCSRERLDMGDGECTWLKLVPLLRARPNMIFPVALLSRCRRHVSAGGRRPAVSEIERRVFGAPAPALQFQAHPRSHIVTLVEATAPLQPQRAITATTRDKARGNCLPIPCPEFRSQHPAAVLAAAGPPPGELSGPLCLPE